MPQFEIKYQNHSYGPDLIHSIKSAYIDGAVSEFIRWNEDANIIGCRRSGFDWALDEENIEVVATLLNRFNVGNEWVDIARSINGEADKLAYLDAAYEYLTEKMPGVELRLKYFQDPEDGSEELWIFYSGQGCDKDGLRHEIWCEIDSRFGRSDPGIYVDLNWCD
ncbi:hypothetical protein KAR91_72950 [Candidatus Pacearchaeota archaeon]|nr:hypothetical protein [Candidatus Pacearchaeota archaeon]